MIIGHRGARNLWPENSLLGFRRLLDLPVDGVEFDVHPTGDGGLVVIHDPTFDRTAEAEGAVSARTLAEATAIRLRGAGDECVPTLDAVLDVFADTDLELHIEIKTDALGNAYPGLERRLVDEVRRRGLAQRAILTCFVPEVLERVHEAGPDIRVLASLDRRSCEMMGGLDCALARLQRIPGIRVAVEKSLLAPALSVCRAALGEERVAAWVPNDPPELAYWLRQPIRALTTDRPDLAVEARSMITAGATRRTE
jgi:glycerophosphoryl diester phosphodiesterase